MLNQAMKTFKDYESMVKSGSSAIYAKLHAYEAQLQNELRDVESE